MEMNTAYEARRLRRMEKLKEILATDYLETVMRDVGIDPMLKRFQRVARSVRILAESRIENRHISATQLYETLYRETGDAPRWINKQIALAIQGAYKSGNIGKMNGYARYRLIDSDIPIGNYLMICELYRVLLFKAIDELNDIDRKNRLDGLYQNTGAGGRSKYRA